MKKFLKILLIIVGIVFLIFAALICIGLFCKTEGTDRAWDGAKSVCSGGSTEGATLCAWVQGMQYPCAGQGRQPCPVKWRFAT